MSQPPAAAPTELTFEQLADAQDLRSVIVGALGARPVDERSLRRGVWTYVGAEHDVGTSPGQVIAALTLLVEGSTIAPASLRNAVMRRVILWCVEAYFGHLVGEGADGYGRSVPDDNRPVPPMIVSNR